MLIIVKQATKQATNRIKLQNQDNFVHAREHDMCYKSHVTELWDRYT